MKNVYYVLMKTSAMQFNSMDKLCIHMCVCVWGGGGGAYGYCIWAARWVST
jgi:hypothetical protein